MSVLSDGSDAQSYKHARLSLTCRCPPAISRRAAAANSSIGYICRHTSPSSTSRSGTFLLLCRLRGGIGPVRPQIDSFAGTGTASVVTCVCFSGLEGFWGKTFVNRSGSVSSVLHSVAPATKANPVAKMTCYINLLTEKRL